MSGVGGLWSQAGIGVQRTAATSGAASESEVSVNVTHHTHLRLHLPRAVHGEGRRLVESTGLHTTHRATKAKLMATHDEERAHDDDFAHDEGRAHDDERALDGQASLLDPQAPHSQHFDVHGST